MRVLEYGAEGLTVCTSYYLTLGNYFLLFSSLLCILGIETPIFMVVDSLQCKTDNRLMQLKPVRRGKVLKGLVRFVLVQYGRMPSLDVRVGAIFTQDIHLSISSRENLRQFPISISISNQSLLIDTKTISQLTFNKTVEQKVLQFVFYLKSHCFSYCLEQMQKILNSSCIARGLHYVIHRFDP